MYGKIFDSIYDGTLRANWQALVTFQQLIILADKDGVVDMTPHAIHGRTGIPLDIIETGLKYLSEPDPYSRSNVEEGRRLVLLDAHRPWGWRLVNHAYYSKLRSIEEKREADRQRIADKRKSQHVEKQSASQSVAECSKQSPTVADVAPVAVTVSVTTESKTTACAEPQAASAPPFIHITLADKTEYPIKADQFHEWVEAFPAVDVLQELRKMRQWCIANPARRKTRRGILNFIVTWLSREQDRGGTSHAARQPVDNSAVGKVRRANEERERRAADAQRQADGSSVGKDDKDVRPPLDQ